MIERLSPVWRNLALALLAVLVIWFSWTVRTVLNPVILAYLLAYVLHPMVERLERRGWSRRAAVNVIFVSTGVVVVLTSVGVFWQGKSLVRAFGEATQGSRSIHQIQERVDQGLATLQDKLVSWGVIDAPATAPTPVVDGEPADPAAVRGEHERAERWTIAGLTSEAVVWIRSEWGGSGAEVASSAAGGLASLLRRVSGSLIHLFTFLVLLPIYTYFLLFELERIHSFIRRYLPGRERERIARIGTQIGEVLSSFFRGRLTVCFFKGVFLAIGLGVCGVPYALLLGFVGGVLALVPVVGPAAAFVFAMLLSLLEFSIGEALLRVGAVYGLAEIIEGYVLIPKILGDSLGLHPVVVIMALTVGGAALGLFGLLVALPLTATVIILVRELVLPAMTDLARDPPKRPPPPAFEPGGGVP